MLELALAMVYQLGSRCKCIQKLVDSGQSQRPGFLSQNGGFGVP
jgi:hypothetical protein